MTWHAVDPRRADEQGLHEFLHTVRPPVDVAARRRYVVGLLKVKPLTKGRVAFLVGTTVGEALEDLLSLQADPDPQIPVVVCEGDTWRVDLAAVKTLPPPEPKRPVRRPKPQQ